MGSGSTRPPGVAQTYLRSEDGEATFHQRGFDKGQFSASKGAVSVHDRMCWVLW